MVLSAHKSSRASGPGFTGTYTIGTQIVELMVLLAHSSRARATGTNDIGTRVVDLVVLVLLVLILLAHD